MKYSLAVDIGGTFTDAVLRSPNNTLTVDKALTTHTNLLEGFFRAAEQVLNKASVKFSDVDGIVVHATTVVTNALIERKGAPTAMITTKGFPDILPIRNEHRFEMYDPQIEFADPLIAREHTFEIDERTLADGTITKTVDTKDVEEIAKKLREAGVASVAICLLNSFRNPENERKIAAALAKAAPEIYISVSSAIAPQIREYPRASTTAINAYTMPITEPYLRGLATNLQQRGVDQEPLIMLSSGGVIGAEVAGRNPVRMIESGPAAGALAAAFYADRLGLDTLMSFDMGGTTAKACLIENRTPLVTGLLEVDRRYRFCEGSGMPLTIPSVDMIEIGAGGGSIASIDSLGLLKVGPHSAGSEPGPACYGRGGQNATVTDADLSLGLLDADNFLGGDMPLDKAATDKQIGKLAAALGVSSEQAASGIYRIVAEAMASAVRTHATDRGFDYRGLTLLAFGGAGPVHACAVAELLQGEKVIFPPQASVLSAFGALVTPVRLDLVRSAVGRLDAMDWATTDKLIAEMEAEGTEALVTGGAKADEIQWSFAADLRYFGQQNEVTVTLPENPRFSHNAEAIRAAFESAYFTQYGVNPSHVPIETVNWRVTATQAGERFGGAETPQRAPGKPKGERDVPLWRASGPAKVYDRASLAPGQEIPGPALIEERETTIVIPAGWTAALGDLSCIIATRGE